MLTPEQCEAIEYFGKELPMKDIAFAGAGKTSTLIHKAKKARTRGRNGIYMCFNKSIATEASTKFPNNVRCSTTHSLAYRDVIGRGYHEDKLRNSPRAYQFELDAIKDKLPFHPDIAKSLVGGTLRRFFQSDHRAIGENHVPRLDGLCETDQEFAYHWVPEAAADAWARMIDTGSRLPMGGDGYVKLWALSNPRLRTDFLMVDEAQDLNGVVVGVVRQQRCQVVLVGDPWQQIYEWRGAKDALAILPGHICRLTQSFRFGDAIAAAGDKVLRAMGETYPLHGFPVIKDRVHFGACPTGSVDAVLCRTNSRVIAKAMDFLEAGRGVCTPNGVKEMVAWVDDCDAVRAGKPARSQEFMGFKDWRSVEEHAEKEEGKEIRTFVRLIGKYGPNRLRRVLSEIRDAKDARPGDVTVSTAHKGKGLEWSSVMIDDDWSAGEDADEISIQERRLFYVAITRAQHNLYVGEHILEAFASEMTDD